MSNNLKFSSIEEIKKLKNLYEQGNSQAKLAEIFSCSQATIGKTLKRNNIKLREYNEFCDITGQKFGNYTAIKFVGRRNNNGNALWLCQCQCGKERINDLSTLKDGKAKSCGECTWVGDITEDHFGQIRRNAKRRGYEFNLTKEYIWKIYQEQKGLCAFTGEEIYFCKKRLIDSNGRKKRITTASVDRKDNSKGYIEGNIQLVHKDVNIMRRNYSIERFIEVCKKVVENCT